MTRNIEQTHSSASLGSVVGHPGFTLAIALACVFGLANSDRALAQTPTLTGSVTVNAGPCGTVRVGGGGCRQDGEPGEGIRLAIRPRSGGGTHVVTAGAGGRFALVLPPGSYAVELDGGQPQLRAASVAVTIPNTGSASVSIRVDALRP
jgi:hypothetical protein